MNVQDTWEYRKSRMQSAISRMDEAVYIELQKRGVNCLFQREFCVQSTVPDIYIPQKRIAIYLDGEKVHAKREDRDEALRELLTKRYGIKVLSIPYKRFSKREVERIVNEILKVIKE